MVLSKIQDGKRFPYSEAEFRRDHPGVLFAKDLVGVDFAAYGVIAEETVHASDPVQPIHHSQAMVSMYAFLCGLREIGLRIHFERYTLALEGHARDYWLTQPYVSKSHTCVAHMCEFFGLSDHDFGAAWRYAESIEE